MAGKEASHRLQTEERAGEETVVTHGGIPPAGRRLQAQGNRYLLVKKKNSCSSETGGKEET
jgi:hypothetical protein